MCDTTRHYYFILSTFFDLALPSRSITFLCFFFFFLVTISRLIFYLFQINLEFFFHLSIEDGIVLSPQRQSFVQGCQIPQSALERNNQQERVKTGLSRTTDRDREGRSRLTGRVGRGRALDYKERTPLQERNKVKLLNCCW